MSQASRTLLVVLAATAPLASAEAAPTRTGLNRRNELHQPRRALRSLMRGVQRHQRFSFGELRRLVRLAKDPAHGGRMTATSKREALVGYSLESEGRLLAPIHREATGSAEFVDGSGQRWDVKAFNSRYPIHRGGFLLTRAISKIEGQFRSGENVILDVVDLKPHDAKLLRKAITKRGWGPHILWFPR